MERKTARVIKSMQSRIISFICSATAVLLFVSCSKTANPIIPLPTGPKWVLVNTGFGNPVVHSLYLHSSELYAGSGVRVSSNNGDSGSRSIRD
ncbi:MAG: hypothetical protein WEB37_07125 [Bacteroidota bacterium]